MTDSKTPWYSDEAGFFGTSYLQNFGSISEDQTKKEIDFIERELKPTLQAKVFDLACGHGRHSIELARRGYKVTGQDLSSVFIAAAKEQSEREGLSGRWVCSDMRNVSFKNEFDLATILFSSFGYLESDAEDQKVVDVIAGSLKPGGMFLFDVRNRDRIIRNYRDTTTDHFSDRSTINCKLSFDPVTGRNSEHYTRIAADGLKTETSASIRLYSVPELITSL